MTGYDQIRKCIFLLYTICTRAKSFDADDNSEIPLPGYVKRFPAGILNERNTCPLCPFTSIYLHELSDHLSTHPDQGLYRCGLCVPYEADFTYVGDLKKHLNNVHLIRMSGTCQTCMTRFQEYHHLQDHLRRTRCGSKQLNLPEESYLDSGKESAKEGISTFKREDPTLADTPRLYICSERGCLFEAESVTALEAHSYAEHSIGPQYWCPFSSCNRSATKNFIGFSRQSNLDEHIRRCHRTSSRLDLEFM